MAGNPIGCKPMKPIQSPKIYYVMGVSASGKSTLGRALSQALGIPFFDGDDYHPPANIEKMSAGIPLTDADRAGWLARLNELARSHAATGAIIACSALKERYRVQLAEGLTPGPCWVVLQGSMETLQNRINARTDHYMPPSLLQSQFDALELPAYGIPLDVSLTTEAMVARVLEQKKAGNTGL